MNNCYFVYILASKRNGTLCVGVAGNLEIRMRAHKNCLFDGFTKRYNVRQLVYYEKHASIMEAIQREKNIKKWNRRWKLRLIEEHNPGWNDLSASWS